MKLTILSLKKKDEYEVVWIEINTPDGNIIIQPGHAPTTYVLSAGKECLYCLKTGKHETLIPGQVALLQVNRTSAILLLD